MLLYIKIIKFLQRNFEIYGYIIMHNYFVEAVIGTSPQGMGSFQHQYRKAVYRFREFIVYR
jgi:hypothetical protein